MVEVGIHSILGRSQAWAMVVTSGSNLEQQVTVVVLARFQINLIQAWVSQLTDSVPPVGQGYLDK